MSSPAFMEQPFFSDGSWFRPVIAATGPTLFMKLTPRKHNPVTSSHVGFRATVWASPGKEPSSVSNVLLLSRNLVPFVESHRSREYVCCLVCFRTTQFVDWRQTLLWCVYSVSPLCCSLRVCQVYQNMHCEVLSMNA